MLTSFHTVIVDNSCFFDSLTISMPKLNKRRTHSRRLQGSLFRSTDDGSSMKNELGSSSQAASFGTEDSDADLDSVITYTVDDVKDLFHMCKEQINTKHLSALLFMCLRHFGIRWRACDSFMKQIGAFGARTSQKWMEIFVSCDFDVFDREMRGGKRDHYLYDVFPELESEARTYAIQRCSSKSADFTALDLARFIDQAFCQISNMDKSMDTSLIRSVESCRLDLRRWGGRFKSNSQRPYFEGHDRPDVVSHREQFIPYFVQRRDHYYNVSDGDKPCWISPKQNPPVVLICTCALYQSFRTLKCFCLYSS